MAIHGLSAGLVEWEGFNETIMEELQAFKVLDTKTVFKLAMEFDHRFWEDVNLLKEGYAVVGG